MKATIFRIHALNTTGRDFIVGDIHGCFGALERQLAAISFNEGADRLFSVGDLVDRGPESKRALEFLNKSWFFPVRGNHEQMFLDLYENGEPDDDTLERHCLRNGMQWWLPLEEHERRAFIAAFGNIPYVAEVPTARGTVGLLHAEVPIGLSWREFLHKLSWGDHQVRQTTIWGRSRISMKDESGVEGIDRVFVGHSIVSMVRKLGNIFYVDTGGYVGELDGDPDYGLSMAALTASTFVLEDGRHDDPDLAQQGSARPFGNYVPRS